MEDSIKKFFLSLNNRGETLNETKPDAEQADGQEGQPDPDAGKSQQQIDWEAENNPYKKRYGDSQSQVQPLVRTLQQFAEYDHTTKTWKPKTQATHQNNNEVDVESVLEGYDPEFRKSLGTYVSRQVQDGIAKSRQEEKAILEYEKGVANAQSWIKQEFGDEFDFVKNGQFNTESPLYKLADQILTSRYCIFNPDGSFHKFTSPDAERLATVEAYAIISKRSKQAPAVDKVKLGAIQGKGTKAGGVGKVLSRDEYFALSDEQKDAYDARQMGA